MSKLQGIELPPGFAPIRLVLPPHGLVLELNRPRMILGRHSQCDVHLPLPDVSRRHCRVLFEDGQWFIEDGDSLNGIFVNNRRVKREVLRLNDCVRIGGYTFVVRPAGEIDHAIHRKAS
jgi:pSer/pThr/pTyr-binding forkhead associated (FHA) protein